MATKIKQITIYKGRYCAELENGQFVLSNGSMGLLLCEKVKDGLQVINADYVCGIMTKSEEDFRWEVEHTDFTQG